MVTLHALLQIYGIKDFLNIIDIKSYDWGLHVGSGSYLRIVVRKHHAQRVSS